ncbi:MAG: hypothetical protein MZV63_12930 [Marinilabiliales bacterium]|nr:hypothetical protein [Marinilabiliales bacterium]
MPAGRMSATCRHLPGRCVRGPENQRCSVTVGLHGDEAHSHAHAPAHQRRCVTSPAGGCAHAPHLSATKSLSYCSYLIIHRLPARTHLPKRPTPIREYTIDDGLPQSESMAIFQDSRGYLWIPTRNGLALFDGHTFISYLRKDGLPSNIVSRVVEDSDGII